MPSRWIASLLALVTVIVVGAIGVARARPRVVRPVSLADIDYRRGKACWTPPQAAGCNLHGCWADGGGCNVHGCWSGARGMCNVHGCSDAGACNVHGCPSGQRPKVRAVCVAADELPDVLGFDPEGPGDCNAHGCWDAGGGCNVHGCWSNLGGCNLHGCWDSPFGSCNVHGCSEIGACNVHGCP